MIQEDTDHCKLCGAEDNDCFCPCLVCGKIECACPDIKMTGSAEDYEKAGINWP